jgi:hypothetical protein
MQRIHDETNFAGVAIAEFEDESKRNFAVIFPDRGRELALHEFKIPEKQANLIRNLKLKAPF